MLEKPDLPDDLLCACLRDSYGLAVVEIAFLPLGYDVNAGVYRVATGDGAVYFLKARRGAVQQASVAIPRYLRDQGIDQVIAPIPTQEGALYQPIGAYNLILYPFVESHTGMDIGMTDGQWTVLGTALKCIHTTRLPPELRGLVQQETYSAEWRELVKTLHARVMGGAYDAVDSHTGAELELAAFWKTHSYEIETIIDRAERYGALIKGQPMEVVLCHADIHTANVLLDQEGRLFIVDWDAPIMAPKERDLMFMGNGIGGAVDAEREERCFYAGYGKTQVDFVTLAYYRFERIVQDFADEGKTIFLTPGADPETCQVQARLFRSNFLPGNALDAAYETERRIDGNLLLDDEDVL